MHRAPVAAVAALIAVLCAGCEDDSSAHRPAASTPRRLTAVLLDARTSAGKTEITYRPARVQHVVEEVEYNKITAAGPTATLPLRPDARILLCPPLNERDDGAVTSPEPVTVASLVSALAQHRSELPSIGFTVNVAADGRIDTLEEIYQP